MKVKIERILDSLLFELAAFWTIVLSTGLSTARMKFPFLITYNTDVGLLFRVRAIRLVLASHPDVNRYVCLAFSMVPSSLLTRFALSRQSFGAAMHAFLSSSQTLLVDYFVTRGGLHHSTPMAFYLHQGSNSNPGIRTRSLCVAYVHYSHAEPTFPCFRSAEDDLPIWNNICN